MKRKLILLILALLVLAGSLGYYFYSKNGDTMSEAKPQADRSQSQASADILKLTDVEAKTIETKTSVLERKQYHNTLTLIGEVASDPDRIVDVPARLSGRLISVRYIEGNYVKKGQILAVVDSPELAKLRSAYHSAKTRMEAAKQNSARISRLLKMKLASEQEQIDAEANMNVIASELDSAKENLRVNGVAISDQTSGKYYVASPMTGVVLNRNAVQGTVVAGNQILATIGSIRELWFLAKLFENDLSKVEEGDKVRVHLNAYPEITFPGYLDHIGDKIDPGSRTVSARMVFKNPERKAKIGLYGEANVILDTKVGITIPEKSITKMQEENYVFVKIGKNEYRFQRIKTGSSEEDFVEVLEGLEVGDEVVTDGVFELKSILLKSTFGEE